MLKQLIAAGALMLSSQAMAEPTQPFVDNIASTGDFAVSPTINNPVRLPEETSSQSGTMATLGLGLLSVVALRGRRKRYSS